MALNISFTPSDWERIKRSHGEWWAHELDRPLVMVEGRVHPIEEYPPVFEPISSQEVIARFTPNMEAMRWYGDAFPRCVLNFGPGIVAGFLGAKVRPTPLSIWFEPSCEKELREIRPVYDPQNAWWERVREVTSEAVRQWQGQVAVTTVDLGGNLDILASLRGETLLLQDLVDHPEEVDRLRAEITSLWLRYFTELDALIRPGCPGSTPWAPIWSQGPNYMLQCDLSCMFSPRMFRRFVLPDLIACCEALEHSFYHLDGPGALVHLETLLAIPELDGIQWVPTDRRPGAPEWYPLLNKIVSSGKLCQIYVSPQEALEVVRNIGGKGFAFYIRQRLTDDDARSFIKLMQQVDIDQ